MKPYYVILTGSKNNAGDYIIKYRAMQLFNSIRPDRSIIDYNAWEPLTSKQLDIINKSKALILTGGPGLQGFMYPRTYPLTKNLNDIKVPIISMGIGYRARFGSWENTSKYHFDSNSRKLLDKMTEHNYLSSVRDYNSLNVLLNKGYNNYLMTGCPVLFDSNFLEKPITKLSNPIEKVHFSLGVSYLESHSMEMQMKELILGLYNHFNKKQFKVVFHHSIDLSNPIQNNMIDWLKEKRINYIDISKTEKKLIAEYCNTDLHIGYRVHAHIYTSSISKPSFLISEDGRGYGVNSVTGGLHFPAHLDFDWTLDKRIKLKLGLLKDTYVPYTNLLNDIINNINYELNNDSPRLHLVRKSIDFHYDIMKKFLKQLP